MRIVKGVFSKNLILGYKYFFVVNFPMALKFGIDTLFDLIGRGSSKEGRDGKAQPIDSLNDRLIAGQDNPFFSVSDRIAGTTRPRDEIMAARQADIDMQREAVDEVVNPLSQMAFTDPRLSNIAEQQATDSLIENLRRQRAMFEPDDAMYTRDIVPPPMEQVEQRLEAGMPYRVVDIGDSVSSVNEFFSGLDEDIRLPDITMFMNRVAATESDYGGDKLHSRSYSPFQIDAIKYQDIVNRSKKGKNKERMDAANTFLRTTLGLDDRFDLRNLLKVDADYNKEGYITRAEYEPSLGLEAHHPLIGAVLTRLGLSHIVEDVPAADDRSEQAKYWKKHWNTEAGKGKPIHFELKSLKHGF